MNNNSTGTLPTLAPTVAFRLIRLWLMSRLPSFLRLVSMSALKASAINISIGLLIATALSQPCVQAQTPEPVPFTPQLEESYIGDSNKRDISLLALDGLIVESLTINYAGFLRKTDLLKDLVLSEGLPFTANQFFSGLDNLAARKVFGSIRYEIVRRNYRLRLTFTLEPEIILTSVQFSNYKVLSNKELLRVARLKTYVPINHEEIERARLDIAKALVNEGYYNATVSVKITERMVPTELEVLFIIDSGDQGTIDKVEFAGASIYPKSDDTSIPDPAKPQALKERITALESRILGMPASKKRVKGVLRQEEAELAALGYWDARSFLEDFSILDASPHEDPNDVAQRDVIQSDVKQSEAPSSVAKKTIVARIKITGGTLYKLSFHGNTQFTSEQLEAILIDKPSTSLLSSLFTNSEPQRFSSFSLLRSAPNKLIAEYQKQGYFFAQVSYREVDEDSATHIHMIIDEGHYYNRGKINIQGNKNIETSELQDLYNKAEITSLWDYIAEPHLQNSTIDRALKAIEELYIAKGFLNPSVTFALNPRRAENDVDAAQSISDKGENVIDLLITIEENSRVDINSINIELAAETPATTCNSKNPKNEKREKTYPQDEQRALQLLEELRSEISSKFTLPMPWQQSEIERIQQILSTKLAAIGSPNANVIVTPNVEQGVIYCSVSGLNQITRYGEITFVGNRYSFDSLIANRLTFKSGDLWTKESVESSIKRLYNTGLFSRVDIQPQDGTVDCPVEDAIVELVERDSGKIKLAASLNTEDGLHLQSEISQKNYFSRGIGASLVADIFLLSESSSSTINSPIDSGSITASLHFLDVPTDELESEISAYAVYDTKPYDIFHQDLLGTNFSISKYLSSSANLQYGLEFYQERIYDTPEEIILDSSENDPTLYSTAYLKYLRDSRNSQLLPSSGSNIELAMRISSSALGSERGFLELSHDWSRWFEITEMTTFATHTSLSYLLPTEGEEVAPLGKRYFLGGRQSLRGFSPGKVGPLTLSGENAGGDLATVIQSELQFKITGSLAILGFLDVGQAFLLDKGTFDGESPDLNDLKYSPGLGLRYLTPLGPLSLEYGLALNSDSNMDGGRFFVGIGGAF